MISLRPLHESDIPAALRLSTQAGWNQLHADWHRLLVLWPQNCIAGWEEDQLVATGTLATFGHAIGWIGMILVDESHRGRGHGGAIFDALLQCAELSGIRRLGLDATDLGRPVYLKRGFVDDAGIDRWTRPASTAAPRPAPTTSQTGSIVLHDKLEDAHWHDLLTLDHAAAGVNRSALLRHLAAEPGAVTRMALRDGRVIAAGIRRSGRNADAIAPVIAHDRAVGEAVIAALVQAGSPDRAIIIDVPRETEIADALQSMGFTVARRLTRMLRPAGDGPTLHSPAVLAGCGFELG
ncbi:MAG: GNAT family N-acetyltransferase [Planctomycetes bacterium]|nr:GNAT family N-acetyltransferase [Planctomycetota bacterium]